MDNEIMEVPSPKEIGDACDVLIRVLKYGYSNHDSFVVEKKEQERFGEVLTFYEIKVRRRKLWDNIEKEEKT